MNNLKSLSKYSELTLISSLILLNFSILTSSYYFQFYGVFPGGVADVAWYYYWTMQSFIKYGGIPSEIIIAPHGLFLLGSAFHSLTNASTLFILKYFFPFLFSLEIIGVYLVVRSITNTKIAPVLASLYISLSPAQFHLAEFHFYKMMFAQSLFMFFVFVCISWIKKLNHKYLIIAILLFFFTYITHRSEALLMFIFLMFAMSAYWYNRDKRKYPIPIIFLFIFILYIVIASKYEVLRIGGEFQWSALLGTWKNDGMFKTSLNQYFFDPELSNFPAPLFALIVPFIVFRKQRLQLLVLIQILFIFLFLNSALELIFYKRYISDLDLFTAINIGILINFIIDFLEKKSLDKAKEIAIISFTILIIAPIATTGIQEQSKINHENDINYNELSAYIYLKGNNGTIFTDSNTAHASWAHAITEMDTATMAISKNRDLANRIYLGYEENQNAFEKPYYFIYYDYPRHKAIKIFDNGGVEVWKAN